MPNAGIFSLSSYYNKDLSGDIPVVNRESFREYGYFGGGEPTTSRVDRIDYSNDTATASVRGSLSLERTRPSATGNSNFGYFGGGFSPFTALTNSVVDRIDYSNDTATASVRGPLSLEKNGLGSTGNSNFGYFSGGGIGQISAPSIFPVITSTDRLEYSNDLLTAVVRGQLTIARGNLRATGNSNFGYFAGGRVSGGSTRFSTINRINYSNDTSIALSRSPLTEEKDGVGASGNSNFGYFAGGSSSPGVYFSIVERLNYSNDLITPTTRGPLSAVKSYGSSTGNSNFGYYSGGFAPDSTLYSTTDRIDYSNDTQTASVRGPLPSSPYKGAATSSASFGGSPISQYGVFPKPFGYFGGGATPSLRSQVDRIDYSNDTSIIRTRGLLGVARGQLAASGNSNFGYFSGGNTGSFISTVDRIDYNNDLQTALVRGPLSSGRYNISASGNSSFGWFCGGREQVSSAIVSTVDRIDYSNDSNTLRVRGSMSSSSRRVTSTGTYNFGYIGGGDNGGPDPSRYISTIQRIDYANDTSTALNRSTFLTKRNASGATGTINFGYFGAGYNETSTLSSVERLDYSTDTTAASSRGSLSLTRHSLAATGNSNFGYFGGGGIDPAPSTYSTIDRLDFSNDISNATIRSSISESRFGLAATSPLTPSSAFSSAQLPLGVSNTDFQPTSTFFEIQSMRRIEDTTNASVKKRVLGSYGYFGGGYAQRTNVYRIDFSNDLAGISQRGSLSTGRRWHSAFSNRNFGYQNSGNGGTPERVDYSNDTSIARTRSYATTGYYHSAVSTNNEFAYHINGANGSSTSTIERLDYSNDNTLLTRGNLVVSINRSAGVGTKSFAYIAGGNRTWVQRLEYANDNANSVYRGNLEIATNWVSAQLGNSNFGYIVGGGSQVQRVDYSNDLAKASIRGPLSSSAYARTGAGNFEFGWVGFNTPAATPGPGSRVERIDYSNDSTLPQIRTNGSGIIYSIGMSNAKF